jgi:hypothetical protein
MAHCMDRGQRGAVLLVVRETYRELVLDGAELLAPWLGPALRGLVARCFKARVCKFTPAEQDGERTCP